MAKLAALCLLLCACAAAHASKFPSGPPAPPGWSEDMTFLAAGRAIYVSADRAVQVDLYAEPPSDAPAPEWIDAHVDASERDHELLRRGAARSVPAQDADVALVDVTRRHRRGGKVQRLIVGAALRSDVPVQVAEIAVPGDFETSTPELDAAVSLLLAAELPAMTFDEMMAGMRSMLDETPPAPAPREPSAAPRRERTPERSATAASPSASTATASAAGVLPSGFENLWLLYNPVNGGNFTVLMTFTDGAFTSAVGKLLADGRAASRRDWPVRWGQWRPAPAGGSLREPLALKYTGKTDFVRPFSGQASIRMANDYRLTGCWSRRGGATLGSFGTGAGSASFSASTFCFDGNGRFSNDRAVSIATTAPSGGGAASGASSGTYRIDGNVLTLRRADGSTVRTAFGTYAWDTEHVFAISIGDGVYL